MEPTETYLYLMQTIRGRLDVIEALKTSATDDFLRAESAAFHGRKIVEAIAFACLVAMQNGLKTVPRDAKGQWNAESIFKGLRSKGLSMLPSPSRIRQATSAEERNDGVKVVIEGLPGRRLSHNELIEIYQRLHRWLHEINPYTQQKHNTFYMQRSSALWDDLRKLGLFVDRHFISIRGSGFFCVLRDSQDQRTKVLPLTKEAAQQWVQADNPGRNLT